MSAGQSVARDATNSISTVDASTHSMELLVSLVRFMRPVIEAIAPSSISASELSQAEQNADMIHLGQSVEGQELVKSFENFIGYVVKYQGKAKTHSKIEDSDSETEDLVVLSDCQNKVEFTLMCKMVDIYIDPVPSVIVDKVNYIVFNNLPIRLLTFDSDGSNIRLIERNTISQLVIERFKEFQHRWRKSNPYLTIQKLTDYAILSHTWIRDTPGDILFQNWSSRHLPENARGYSKLAKFCQIAAREHGVRFGWMDTACINKESSTELDESIRSMFKWYKGAFTCITYLSETLVLDQMHKDAWFTRGWTLQELLANEHTYFYNQRWEILDPSVTPPTAAILDYDKYHEYDTSLNPLTLALKRQIFQASSITSEELHEFYHGTEGVRICRVMQLAARRKVTRKEDQIYSLMGLLGVQIPIAYGEGSRNALRRMFRELMISKTNFLDLFNHGNSTSIVPSRIENYIHQTPTAQNKVFPKHPLLYSHLGIHATLVAVPIFLRDRFADIIPAEITTNTISWGTQRFSGHTKMYRLDYVVLDNSSASANWVSNFVIPRPSDVSDDKRPALLYNAIISSNISQDDDFYQLSAGPSLGIPVPIDLLPRGIETSTGTKLSDVKPIINVSFPSTLHPLNPLRLELDRGPKVLNLPYSGPNVKDGVFFFNGAEAARLGIKVVTGYFR